MILKQLSLHKKNCVFKGGTSLSKCHHVIDRFSEDIDITFSDTLSQGERKKLKNNVIAGISEYLELPISDWEKTHSRRDYNCYIFQYTPIEGYVPESLIDGVKMEVVLGSIAFPTVEMEVDSYIYQVLKRENMDLVELYELQPFTMKIQSLERTFIDKVFALCDYFIKSDIDKRSRHIYDLYMLMPKMIFDEDFKYLVEEVRIERQKKPEMCPSSLDDVDINNMLGRIISEAVYEEDYEAITSYFQKKRIDYETAIEAVKKVIDLKVF